MLSVYTCDKTRVEPHPYSMFAYVDRVIDVLNAPVRILLTTIEDLVKLVSLPPLADYGIASGE